MVEFQKKDLTFIILSTRESDIGQYQLPLENVFLWTESNLTISIPD